MSGGSIPPPSKIKNNKNKQIVALFTAALTVMTLLALLSKHLSVVFAGTFLGFFFEMLHLFLIAILENVLYFPLIQAEMRTECGGSMSKEGSSQSPPQKMEYSGNSTFDEQVVPSSANVRMVQANFDLNDEQKQANETYLVREIETSDRMLTNGIGGASSVIAASALKHTLPTPAEILGGAAATVIGGEIAHLSNAALKKPL